MKIAFLTSGGNAPCLNSSIGRLLFHFSKIDDEVHAVGYLNGFSGLLKNNKINLPTKFSLNEIDMFYSLGGSLIGNSRIKLTNVDDCLKKGLISDGQIPLEVAADQLIKDKIDILFTIGGDDTNTTAKDLQNHINSKNINITVIGIPKTIDNDIFPIKRSLGAYTAASSGAMFFQNIVNENFMSEHHLIVHEVMGRNSGWLTGFTAKMYYDTLDEEKLNLYDTFDKRRYDIHGIYVPEREIPAIIGQGGKRIHGIEQQLGIKLTVKVLEEKKESTKFNTNETKKYVIFEFSKSLSKKSAEFSLEDNFLFSAIVSNRGEIKIHKKSEIGRKITDALDTNKKIEILI